MTSIDETTNATNTEKIEKIEESIGALENYIVKLTQNRALFEEFVTTQSSPKKTSVAGKMKNSIRKRRDKGSTGSNGNEGKKVKIVRLDIRKKISHDFPRSQVLVWSKLYAID